MEQSMSNPPPAPKVQTDGRIPLRFFSCLAGMFVCSGGLVLVVVTSPKAQGYMEQHPWLILVAVAGGFLCVAAAAFPWLFGIRCRQCRRWLRRMAVTTDLTTGNAPLRFYCKACNVIWETHLVSGPGNSD
jgi:hypothetical protein